MKVKEESEKSGCKCNIQNTHTHTHTHTHTKPQKSWHPAHNLMANKWGTMETATDLFSWAPKSLQMVTPAMKLKDTCSLEEKQ